MKLIKGLVGDKPSSQWTDDDIQTLNKYLDTFDTSDIIDVDIENSQQEPAQCQEADNTEI